LATASWAVKPVPKEVGHGGKNMPYYGLEVIAFDNCPAGDFTGSNRRMIAVQADFADDPGGKQVGTFTRVNDIKLAAGSEFGVIDGNACDGDAKVTFETVPGICSSGTCQSGSDLGRLCTINEDCGPSMEYRVFVRMVGKPGGKIDVKTCTTDPASGVCDDSTNTCTAGAAGEFCSTNEECDIVVCSTENVVKLRTVGKNNKPKFSDYTNELLTLCLDEDGDGDCDTRVPLFSTQYEDYFWNWNTQGRPHAQLRFYPL
jgi:hypothetical protein